MRYIDHFKGLHVILMFCAGIHKIITTKTGKIKHLIHYLYSSVHSQLKIGLSFFFSTK